MKHISEALAEAMRLPEINHDPRAEEAAHCICPSQEAHAAMDEKGDYLDAHKPGVVA